MRKIIALSIPILILALSVFVMNSNFLFKTPGGYRAEDHIDAMKRSVHNGDWETVSAEISEMESIVKNRIFPYVQFSVERDDLNMLDMNIYRIRGTVDARDKGLALLYLEELRNEWHNLGR